MDVKKYCPNLGGCKNLVRFSIYGNCKNFCESIGSTCNSAHVANSDDCKIKKDLNSCYDIPRNSSDLICDCTSTVENNVTNHSGNNGRNKGSSYGK